MPFLKYETIFTEGGSETCTYPDTQTPADCIRNIINGTNKEVRQINIVGYISDLPKRMPVAVPGPLQPDDKSEEWRYYANER